MIDLAGKTFGYLTVVKRVNKEKPKQVYWLCKCKCGNETVVQSGNLRTGSTKSCGCYGKEVARKQQTKHGLYYHPMYKTYNNIKQRCTNPKHKDYYLYGERGISVCNRWLESFKYFLEDMGERPEGKTVDRINNYGNYEPTNCRWATHKEQRANQRKRK